MWCGGGTAGGQTDHRALAEAAAVHHKTLLSGSAGSISLQGRAISAYCHRDLSPAVRTVPLLQLALPVALDVTALIALV